jgi:hypothetical protein
MAELFSLFGSGDRVTEDLTLEFEGIGAGKFEPGLSPA